MFQPSGLIASPPIRCLIGKASIYGRHGSQSNGGLTMANGSTKKPDGSFVWASFNSVSATALSFFRGTSITSVLFLNPPPMRPVSPYSGAS